MIVTALAFRLSYRSIREHIVLNDLRNEFISNMTHELKTPVATLSVALESLAKYNMKDEPAVMEDYLKLASLETKRLEDLINRILDHSMLEHNGQPLNPVLTDINRLVQEVAGIMRQRLEKDGKIEFLSSDGKLTAMADPLFLRGVLVNLVDNSIKYCDKAPVISILTRKEAGFAVIGVTDNGPGIPEEYQGKIFEKFFRLPTGNVHNVKGYGLGLSFASLVMKLHKGSITVKNNAVGCSFTLKVPVA
jgi:two-component system phosphate regulon sensor histidine kinase PhoR